MYQLCCEYCKLVSYCGLLYIDEVIATLAAGRRRTHGAITIREIWDLPPRTKHVLHLNAKGQPIGESGG